MLRTRSTVLALAAAAALTVPLGTAGPATAGQCRSLDGHLSAVGIPQFANGALSGFHVIVTSATGDLAGATVTADLVVTDALPGGTLHLDGPHHFADPASGLAFTTSDHVRITPNGVVNDTLTVVEGGTGMLHTHGSVDLATGAVELDYHGQVCG
jgi:hypothetical protein